jgi:hypothetical protein
MLTGKTLLDSIATIKNLEEDKNFMSTYKVQNKKHYKVSSLPLCLTTKCLCYNGDSE